MTDQQQSSSPQTMKFSADETQLLNLVAHSLYSDEDIFLREMISNASDALDKFRFEALKDNRVYGNDTDLAIWIDINKEQRTITIRDNGIGMTKQDAIDNLGTIAKSGTQAYRQQQNNSDDDGGNSSDDKLQIGQFGVGFYAGFMVANKMTVYTRHFSNDSSEATLWSSQGQSNYEVSTTNKTQRGTEIILHLRENKDAYLDGNKLRDIIHKFSDHIAFPIYMHAQVSETETDTSENTEAASETENKDDKKTPEYERVNQAQALWTRSKSEIKDEEYNTFYQHISNDFNEPLCHVHNQVSGSSTEYTSLLYIPKHAPFDLWYQDMHRGLKLYVRRVFIMDEAENFLPLYLRFVRGIIDADSLPLNISRELLQDNRVVNRIRTGCVKRILTTLEKMAEDDQTSYEQFWDEFGQVIKEGVGQDFANKDRITKLLRFSTTHDSNQKQRVSLNDYISRMDDKQDKIYYITADSFNAAKNSPLLEMFKKKNIEVILLSDRVDEWLVAHLTDVEGKQLQSIAKGDIDLGEETEAEKQEKEQQAETHKDLIERLKTHFKDQVNDIRLTQRLTDSPACVVYQSQDMGGHMQRLIKQMGQDVPKIKPVLELNPDHRLVSQLNNIQDDDKVFEWVDILLQQALLAEGQQMEDPSSFIKQLNKMWTSLI